MKKFFLLLVTIVIYGWSPAQSQADVKNKVVEQTVLDFFEALSNNDSISLKALSTPDILLFEYGSMWTLDTLLIKAFRPTKPADFKRVNTIKFINTNVAKDVAWSTYRNKAEITANSKLRVIEWLETVVLIRQNKKWRIKILHSSLVKQS